MGRVRPTGGHGEGGLDVGRFLDHGGRDVPLFCFTIAVSAALMLPFAFISERKFVASTVCPRRALVCATSAAFTVALAFVSPIKMLIGIVKSVAGASVAVALLTPLMRTLIVCALAMFVNGIVTILALTLTLPLHTPPLPTHPVPTVTSACGEPVTVTLPANVTTIV